MRRTIASWACRTILAATAIASMGLSPTAPVARFSHFRYDGRQPAYDGIELAKDQFLNPILEGFRPDPSIVRVGSIYYLATSTFAYFPGATIMASRDLVHWRYAGAAVSRPDEIDLDHADVSGGLYAPDLKYHAGIFYLLDTCLGCGGNFIVTAKTPSGPWSTPVWLPFPGIDPSIVFDDGRAYVVNDGPPAGAPRYSGHRAIWLQEIDLKTMKMVGERSIIVDGGADIAKHPAWIEGPHIFRRGGYYYLICAEGGTEDQHSEVAFRSRAVNGPYLPDPTNPILTQRDLPDRVDPVTNTGHADFVQTPPGAWWAVFLGARPYRDDLFLTGRETFLAPVKWDDGWPRITAPGESVALVQRRPDLTPDRSLAAIPSGDFTFSDAFSGSELGPAWTWLRNPRERWGRTGGDELRLAPRPQSLGGLGNPAFLAIRQAHMNAKVIVDLAYGPAGEGDRAGLAAFQDARHYIFLGVQRTAGGEQVIRLERRASADDPLDGAVVASAPLHGDTVSLKLAIEVGRMTASYAEGGGPWRPLGGTQDVDFMAPALAHGFTGVMLGLYAHSAAPR